MDKMKIDDFIKKLDNLKNELKEEEEKFNNCKNINEKGMHLDNINKLNFKIVRLNYKIKNLKGIDIECDDFIKMPFEYIASEEESLFYNPYGEDKERW